MRDWKGIAEPQLMTPKDMRAFGEVCGATLARAQSYADQNERDHQALTDAVRSGRVPAQNA